MSTSSAPKLLMVVNRAIVVIINKYIFILEYFTSKSYLTDNAASNTKVTMVATIAESLIKSLSMLIGERMVVAAIGIEVERPIMMDMEFKITLDFFLNVARLYIPAVIMIVVCPRV